MRLPSSTVPPEAPSEPPPVFRLHRLLRVADMSSPNPWTPEQWRVYNRRTGDRHVARSLPPVSQRQVLAEDLAQERELARLEHRRDAASRVDAYRRREMTFIRLTRPLTFRQTGEEPDG